MIENELRNIIFQAGREKATQLNLYGRHLTSLPTEITELTSLTELNLSCNQLTSLPAEIGHLTNLKTLNLNDNQLTSLPMNIGQLTSLSEFKLSRNQLSSLPVEIGQLTSLTQLSLSGNQLISLPVEIGRLFKLKELELNSNQLTSLPAEIGQLSKLIDLELNGNQLTSLPREIGQLTQLTMLELNGNQLTSLPKEIGQLTKLVGLELSGNQLTSLPKEIGQLTNLELFNLYYNQLTFLPVEIGQLTQLIEFELNGNQLKSLPVEIGQLTNLKMLNLYYNRLTSLPVEIGQLINLTELELSGNQLKFLPEEIGRLSNLIVLELYGNELTSLPVDIGQLSNLKTLNLSDNQLTSLPVKIGQLSNLIGLNLSKNQIKSMLREIGQLSRLTELNLSGNRLKSLPKEIGQLSSLIKLYLYNNQLTSLPVDIIQLYSLTELNLSDNQLASLPKVIGQLKKLTEIKLSDNKLTTLPKEIGQLSSLKMLNLSGNQLTFLPMEISQLSSLTGLELSGNQLTSLPVEIGQLPSIIKLNLSDNELTFLPVEIVQLSSLIELELQKNPIKTPPLEIVTKGWDSIKNYLRQLAAEEKDYIYEAKVIIVGEPGAGKTTLAKKIEDQSHQLSNDEITTKGIDVIKWNFQIDDGRDFRVNIWDFGGQEIYHTTHQFFLTKRSLYLLVADTRKEDTDFYYWCNIVALLSENSPLIVVKNEKQNRHREINERKLRGQFTNFKETLSTNLATNRGLADILTNIKHYTKALPHIGNALPITWIKVREILENNRDRNYITFEEYLDICEENGFKQKEDKLQLSGYLHDLGVCLHFQEDSILKKIIIINPEWGTDAVYKVLDNDIVITNQGKFTRSDLAKIWNEDKYTDMQDELIHLMVKFQLCYEIPETSETYIAPQLLTENQPEYVWSKQNNLILRYVYEFMPKGIITRFIVAMNFMISDQDKVWKSGVILEKDETLAEIIEYQEKSEIKIRLYGKNKHDLLVIIIHELDKIHKSFHRLKYDKLIPCNCVTCKKIQEPHFYQLTELKEFIKDGQSKIQCRKKPYQMVSVSRLMYDVMEKKDLENSGIDISIENEPIKERMKEKVLPKTIKEFHYHEGDKMGDIFKIDGQIGAAGRGAHAHNINFNQIWKETGNEIDLEKLSKELAKIRSEGSKLADAPEKFFSIGEVAAAEIEAKAGNGVKMLEHLKKAGKWAIDVSTNIGTSLATELLKKSMGL